MVESRSALPFATALKCWQCAVERPFTSTFFTRLGDDDGGYTCEHGAADVTLLCGKEVSSVLVALGQH